MEHVAEPGLESFNGGSKWSCKGLGGPVHPGQADWEYIQSTVNAAVAFRPHVFPEIDGMELKASTIEVAW